MTERQNVGGKIMAGVYLAWSVALAGMVLANAGARMSAPDGGDGGWIVVLVWIPVLLLVRKGTAAYGRTAEILRYGMLAALVLVLVLGGRQIRLERLLGATEDLGMSFASAVGVSCCGVAAVLLWDGEKKAGDGQWMKRGGSLAAVILLMRAVTVGVLGPVLAERQPRPFFLMTVGAGRTARVEGLAAAVWLLADIVLAGLMLRCGKKMWGVVKLAGNGEWAVALAALAAALWVNGTGQAERCVGEILPVTGLILGGEVPAAAYLAERKKRAALQRKSKNMPSEQGNEKR